MLVNGQRLDYTGATRLFVSRGPDRTDASCDTLIITAASASCITGQSPLLFARIHHPNHILIQHVLHFFSNCSVCVLGSPRSQRACDLHSIIQRQVECYSLTHAVMNILRDRRRCCIFYSIWLTRVVETRLVDLFLLHMLHFHFESLSWSWAQGLNLNCFVRFNKVLAVTNRAVFTSCLCQRLSAGCQ